MKCCTNRIPSYVEVAFVMSRFLLSQKNSHNHLHDVHSGTPQDLSIQQLVMRSLMTNKVDYCEQLADVIVHMSNRTVEGKVLDCLLEVFLSSFPEFELPSSTADLCMVADLKQTLTNIFMKATSLNMPHIRGDSRRYSTVQSNNGNGNKHSVPSHCASSTMNVVGGNSITTPVVTKRGRKKKIHHVTPPVHESDHEEEESKYSIQYLRCHLGCFILCRTSSVFKICKSP